MNSEVIAALRAQKCTVVLTDNKAKLPRSMAKGFRFKGHAIKPGAPLVVDAYTAGRLVYEYAELVTITKGDAPPIGRPLPAASKRLVRATRERMETFGRSPTEALQHIPAISEKVLKTLRSKRADEAVAAGEVDDETPQAALWAQLSGRAELAALLVMRAEALLADDDVE